MARIAGVDIPNKHVDTALTYIYGIGRSSAMKICEEAKIDPLKMMNDLSQDELTKIREIIDRDYKVEGRLRSEVERIYGKKSSALQRYREDCRSCQERKA